MAEHKGLDPIQKELLAQVADLHKMPEGAYSLRINGQLEGKNSSEHIQIVKKTDAPGIDIYIQPGTKNESMHIPVLLSQTGLKELVYNDFHIGADCDVTIVAGCGIRYEAVVKNEGAVRLDIEQALKNVRPMKMSEVGSSVKMVPLWAVDLSFPQPYKDGYLFLDTEGLYLLDSAYHKKRMLVKNVCHYKLYEKNYAYVYKYTLCKPLRVDEEKGIIQCQFRARFEESGMATFSLEKLMQSDSVLHTQDYQSLSPEVYPLLFTSDAFITYKKNTGTFYTHTFRGDTLCRFELMPDYLPTADYRMAKAVRPIRWTGSTSSAFLTMIRCIGWRITIRFKPCISWTSEACIMPREKKSSVGQTSTVLI